jgi:hypothetical protein
MSNIKVFKLNECDWWAGEDLISVTSAYMKETDGEVDDFELKELTEEDMNKFKLVDDDGETVGSGTVLGTFREVLDRMIASGQTFPCFFASTEY